MLRRILCRERTEPDFNIHALSRAWDGVVSLLSWIRGIRRSKKDIRQSLQTFHPKPQLANHQASSDALASSDCRSSFFILSELELS